MKRQWLWGVWLISLFWACECQVTTPGTPDAPAPNDGSALTDASTNLDAAGSDLVGRDLRRPDTGGQDLRRPDTAGPDYFGVDTLGIDLARPDAAMPDQGGRDALRPDRGGYDTPVFDSRLGDGGLCPYSGACDPGMGPCVIGTAGCDQAGNLVCNITVLTNDEPCGTDLVCRDGRCVSTLCGGLDQACCTANPRCSEPGTICDTFGSNTCIACGGQDEPCCQNRSCDSVTLSCDINGDCVPCGGADQPCCAGDVCTDPTTTYCTWNNVCEACGNGASSEPCCPGDFCASGGCCVNGDCVAAGTACGGGLTGDCTAGACGTCGALSQACCTGDVCTASGTTCDGTNCVACGGVDQPCCADDVCVAAGTSCDGTNCVACGAPGQPCCANNVCQTGCCTGGFDPQCVAVGADCGFWGVCLADGSCQQCGTPGEACCPGADPCPNGCCSNYIPTDPTCVRIGGDCAPNLLCAAEATCEACGADTQQCCANNGCDDGLGCDRGTDTCEACGGDGQACCDGFVCNAGLGCDYMSNTCGTCGTVAGEPCCSDGTCASGLVCNARSQQCEACGGDNQACCALNSCNAGGCCERGTCTAATQQCLNNQTCTDGSCDTCGGLTEPCCGNQQNRYCTAPSSYCNRQNNNTCEACGGAGQRCCANFTCAVGQCNMDMGGGTCP